MRRLRRQRFYKSRNPFQFSLHQALFVLPNLFTISSVFCGFYAMSIISHGTERLYEAALAIFFGLFFDMADGRVARLTRTQSDFGVQLDSLADVITFGVAPGMLVYHWSLIQMGALGVFVAFIYVACGALRLARFNVTANSHTGPSHYFTGVPIPLAAAILVSLIMFHQQTYGGPAKNATHVLALVLVLAYLMISNVRYRTFKNMRLTRTSIVVFIAVNAGFAILALVTRTTFALLITFSGYLAYGLVEEVWRFGRPKNETPPFKPTDVAYAAGSRKDVKEK